MPAVRLVAVAGLVAGVLALPVAAPPAAQATIIGGSATLALGTPSVFDLDVGFGAPANTVTLAGAVVFDGPDGHENTANVGCLTMAKDGVTVESGSVAPAGFVDLDPSGDGTFNVGVPVGFLPAPCRLAVIPSAGPAGLSGGQLVTKILRQTTRAIGAPNAGAIKDALFTTIGPDGIAAIADPDRGTPYDLAPVENAGGLPSPRRTAWGFGGEILDAANLPGTRSSVLLDGKNVYSSGEEAAINDSIPGLRGLTIDNFSQAGANPFDLDVTMTEPFLTCGSPCEVYQEAGIKLRRRAVTSQGGRVMTVTDTWLSTDGQPHTLDVLLQYETGGGPAGFNLPWIDGGTFVLHSGGSVTPPPGRVSTMYVRTNPLDVTGDTEGSLTLSARPTSMKFTADNAFQLQFQRNVPAAGGTTIVSTYTAGTGSANSAAVIEAEAAANAATPKVAITSPTSVTGDSAYTATGTASSQAGIASVKVNGVAATVAPDGTWSAPLTLAVGANPVSAVLTDGDGETATATASVGFIPLAAAIAFGGKPVFKKGVLTLNLGCQGPPGQSCVIAVLLNAGLGKAAAARTKTVTLLKKTLHVAVGLPHPVKLKLSKGSLKRIPKGRSLKAKLTLTQTVSGRKTTKSYVLKLRR